MKTAPAREMTRLNGRRWLQAVLPAGVLLAGMLLASCGKGGPAPQESPVYKPPTLVVPSTPLILARPSPTPQVSEFHPTATAQCLDSLSFVEDLSVPDGSVVPAGSIIDKRWRVENTGSCNWDERYSVRLVAGPEMGVPEEQALYPARGGAQAILRMVFVAPQEAGTYRSAWQAFNPQGDPFGDTFFLDVVVP